MGSFQGLCYDEAKRERLFLCQSRIRGIVDAGHVELAVLHHLRRWRCTGAFSALCVPWSILLRAELTMSLLWEPAPLHFTVKPNQAPQTHPCSQGSCI